MRLDKLTTKFQQALSDAQIIPYDITFGQQRMTKTFSVKAGRSSSEFRKYVRRMLVSVAAER